ncbi:MAG: hypothetical protein Q4D51_10500, partial [Eubacteriales bacterium]|nr:hypothetical protein [Eubacteriales bacterium]
MVEVNLNGSGTIQEQIDNAKKEYYKTLSPDQIKNQTVYEKKTREYKGKYIQYMGYKIDAKSLTEDVTQPYYQSMILNRKRLDEKNVQIDMSIDTNTISEQMPFDVKKDEKFSMGERQDALKVRRTFLLNGKKIKKIKSKETSKITFLNLNVNENQETFCPNCGYADSLSGFINGCDACGAVFTVNDFEPKIAAFSMQENRVSKYYGTIFKAWLTFFITMVLGAIIVGKTVNLSYGIVLAAAFPFEFVPSLFVMLFIISVVLKNVWATVVNEKLTKDAWKWFSTDDFLQNLEYKIKNIHMAKSYKEVNAFARCSLLNAINSYQNVIDCDIAHIEFKDVSTTDHGYQISFSSVLRLIELKGKKIKTHYEKIDASVYGKRNVVDQPITS